VAQSGAERSFGKPEKHNSVQSGEFLRCAQDDEATLVFRSAGIKNTKLIHVPVYPPCSDLLWRRWWIRFYPYLHAPPVGISPPVILSEAKNLGMAHCQRISLIWKSMLSEREFLRQSGKHALPQDDVLHIWFVKGGYPDSDKTRIPVDPPVHSFL
jgi:hypothetical protein